MKKYRIKGELEIIPENNFGLKNNSQQTTLVRVSLETHKNLRLMAAIEGVSMQDIVDKLVVKYKRKKHPDL